MTQTTKHTPGPWECNEVRTDCGRAFRIGSGEMLKAGMGCCIIYDDYPGNPENERKANARLIAAAPDMLETMRSEAAAVKREADWLESQTRWDNRAVLELRLIENRLRAAIAKVEGRA